MHVVASQLVEVRFLKEFNQVNELHVGHNSFISSVPTRTAVHSFASSVSVHFHTAWTILYFEELGASFLCT